MGSYNKKMPNLFEKELKIPKPKCCSTGDCCKGVSPSTPYYKLLERASTGDEFAQNFFSIMIPYASHTEAEQVVPGVVKKTLEAAKKLDDFPNDGEDVVFYHCRYLQEDNRCGIHEDRPQFCRDYPDTPFVVMAPNCAYIPWGKACKKKYFEMKDEIVHLKDLKQELSDLKQGQINPSYIDSALFSEDNKHIHTDGLSLVLSLTNLHLASPGYSFVFHSSN